MTQNDLVHKIRHLGEKAPAHEATHLHSNLITLLTHGRSNKMAPVVKTVLSRKPGRILDIGCGYGAISIFFALQGMETVGIDLQEEHLQAGEALAKELGISTVSFEKMDACAISVNGFDVALSTDFFEHLPYESQSAHLHAVRKALNQGGALLSAPRTGAILANTEKGISACRPLGICKSRRQTPSSPCGL